MKSEIVSGALFDFLGYLTLQKTTLKVGANHDVVPLVELLKNWAKARNLDIDNPDTEQWDTRLED